MPTRLLKLEHPAPNHLQLCATEIDGINGAYMTLSHCWGKAKFLTLTKESSSQLFKGIRLSLLPRTFQDAAKIVKRLGVDYLWIDSLCIFQDSKEDWQEESSTMSDIYKGSVCNIAASVSTNGNDGCIHFRDPRLIEPCIVTTEYTDQVNDQYHIMVENFLAAGPFDNQLLFTRGWVVQERVLPARVLHFGERQVFWECRRGDASETYPFGLPPNMVKSEYCIKRPWPLQNIISVPEQQSAGHIRDIYLFWWKIVQAYSKCDLSYEQDKLVAISGIAKEVSRALGERDQYLAGLWRGDILNGLLWRRKDELCLQPKEYRAPSWSWAHLDGQIARPQTAAAEFYVTLVDAQLDYLTKSSFGQVKNGYIRLRGRLSTVSLEKKRQERRYPSKNELFGEAKFPLPSHDLEDELDEPDDSLSDALNHYYDAFLNGKQLVDEYPVPQLDTSDNVLLQSLHFMEFCKESNGGYREGTTYKGLLLQPTGQAKGQFRRCGILHAISRGAEEKDAMEKAGLLDRSRTKIHDWLEYEEHDGKEYIISII
jgi:Heterokaryon incompatibility protein (HET)